MVSGLNTDALGSGLVGGVGTGGVGGASGVGNRGLELAAFGVVSYVAA